MRCRSGRFMLQSAFVIFIGSKEKRRVFLRIRPLILSLLLSAACGMAVFGQQPALSNPEKKPEKTPAPTPVPTPAAAFNPKDPKTVTADQVAESAVFVYGGLGGRATLSQIRKTALERGKVTITGADGKKDLGTYARWTQRADTLSKEKIRLDQDFPNARYSMVFNEEKIFGIFNDSIFTPREDASKAFENQIVHGIEALLRYKENESKVELAGKEKFFGVEYYQLDLTDKQNRKTRFHISVKTLRVMMLDYEDQGVKYRRKFYDYNYAQGTLVPYRTVLWANDKIVEETDLGTVTFGQKIDESMFPAGS
jgi:hypothetical protein